MASRKTAKSREPDVLSAAYLEGTSNKNELLRRLSHISDALASLSDDDDDDDESPRRHSSSGNKRPIGLPSLSATIVSSRILQHRDPTVRLYAALVACDLFYAYAPDPPWSGRDCVTIFTAIVQQITKLGEYTETCGDDFDNRFRILEQLSEVKIGVVLVDIIRTESIDIRRNSSSSTKNHKKSTKKSSGKRQSSISDDDDDDDFSVDEDANGLNVADDAQEVLCDLLRALLTCVRPDHPPEVASHAELAIVACLEEFEGGVPYRVLEELLMCVGRGPIVWVTNPAFAGGTATTAVPPSSTVASSSSAALVLPPARIQVTNPSYLVAARVLRRAEDKISSPIAALLNGLLAGDPTIVGSTTLSTEDSEAKKFFKPVKGRGNKGAVGKNNKKKSKGGGADDNEKDDDYHEEGGSPVVSPDHNNNDHEEDDDNDESGANVYSVSYELHRIAPQILTTVIGTVATSLTDMDLARRWQAVRLLGRLFGARTSDIASKFSMCFREWLRRSYDPEPKIRETMVKCLVNFLSTQHAQTDLCADVNEALAVIIQRDPMLDIRLLGIHQVCELAHSATIVDPNGSTEMVETGDSNSNSKKRSVHPMSVVSSDLLHAVGNRVSSKNKKEHKDAITGLAQIYHRHYIRAKLKHVQEGGEDVSIDEILDVFQNCKSSKEQEEKFAWIPQLVFKCMSYPDNGDPEMRNRVLQIVDDVLLGTAKGGGSALTPTSRAVGLAIIISSVKDKEHAFKWMRELFVQRGRLQLALGGYLDARSRARECDAGSPGAYAADGDAVEKLELVASLTAPLGSETSNSKTELESILKKVHAAKDKHIFRILSTISSPTHSPSSRLRAFDELPKRTKGLGGAVQSWIKTLARRCAMGAFLDVESIEHCIILSQECFEAEDCEVSALFLNCIKLAVSIFPSLGSTKKGFQNLVEFFDASRSTSTSSSMKRSMEKYGVVTMLSDILARCGTVSRPTSAGLKKGGVDDEDFDFEDNKSSRDTLHEQLLRLCTHDGTPEQARNAVFTISSMIKSQSEDGESIASRASKEKKEFDPLLKALVTPSRLLIPDESSNPKSRGRIVSIMSAIAAIAECAPYAFNECGEGHKLGWGERALAFALDTVLLGKNARLNSSVDEDESSGSDDDEEESPVKGRRNAKNTKGGKANEVSVHSQMISVAIEVLVSHIRSTVVVSRFGELTAPSPSHITGVFSALTKLIEDGTPQSRIIGRYCKTAKDQAELRRSAAVNLLRLCDANLQLEAKYLTPKMWHVLSSALVDEDNSVSSSVMGEVLAMYSGSGKFRANTSVSMVPSLRFVSLVTLCVDNDSSMGKKVKKAATLLIKQLRTTSQVVQAQCRQQGRNAEKNFENRLKLHLMPEYSVPYAIHLLLFRQETASTAGLAKADSSSTDSDDEAVAQAHHIQEASKKMLKQRLKWLFDPLIQSLGSGADNISFLMRMIDLIGKHPPINVTKTTVGMSSLELSLYDDDDYEDIEAVSENELVLRMKIICQLAREVLLSHVKKDINLTVYPGTIQFPGDLYSRPRPSSTSPVNAYAYKSEEESEEESKRKKSVKPKKSISHYVKKSQDELPLPNSDDSDYDDEIEDKKGTPANDRLTDDTYEHSPSLSPSPPKSKSNELEISPCVTKSDKSPRKQQGRLSSDSYDHSPSFTPSTTDNGGFDNFGDVSPISHAESPATHVVAKSAPKKHSSMQPEVKKRRSKSSTNSEKRKSKAIDVFDEYATVHGDDDSPAYGQTVTNKKRKSTTPTVMSKKGGGNAKKSKAATPVSVPKSVMVNVTNSTTTSSSHSNSATTTTASAVAAAAKKKKVSKTKVVTKSVDESDDFDFTDDPSPVKTKTTGRLGKGGGKKSSSSSAKEKIAVVSKAKAPVKSTVGAVSKKTKKKQPSPSSAGSSTIKSPSASSVSAFSSEVSSVRVGRRRGAR